MIPNVSPNSSSKNGPTTPGGSVWRMSATLLRTWYQVSSTSLAVVAPFRLTKIVVTPGLREAAQEIEVGGLLQGALEPLGDLEQGLVDRGARPHGLDHHRADRERRVLGAPEAVEGERPREG